jgi:hypothetical protein
MPTSHLIVKYFTASSFWFGACAQYFPRRIIFDGNPQEQLADAKQRIFERHFLETKIRVPQSFLNKKLHGRGDKKDLAISGDKEKNSS